ncbi:hypothetical protein XNC1_1502 [Xenorhabdus nematophila ATCC 19061]|uniref:Uncharacterized protein n=1 Tax=Xenorhabdus nematophila (strain ATCC 19061 / DSM 3370 / CCUG 14189 / LMG 1036 / NCIMB 9965 / AN6) TaxID=406817 RepID=D3VBC6_XENNA|nr:hypothetical protein XNC1_1502 [Xenorhabdus nematophila ATCC 19061]
MVFSGDITPPSYAQKLFKKPLVAKLAIHQFIVDKMRVLYEYEIFRLTDRFRYRQTGKSSFIRHET